MKLHLFNPENDLALADGGFSYHAPPAAMRIANDLAALPLWYAGTGDAVVLSDEHHKAFCDRMSSMFPMPVPFVPSMHSLVTSLAPWGWSAQMRHRFRAMGFDQPLLPCNESMDAIRRLSNRMLTIEVLNALRNAGVDTPPLPKYVDNLDEAVAFVSNHNRCVVKAPWSGSGKGIMWGIGRAEVPMVHFCKGVIRRQGGVMCEEFLNAKVEFAMEFHIADGTVGFAGYSLFNAENGAYTGNILCPNGEIEARLSQYISIDLLDKVKVELCSIMQRLLAGSGYDGYFGIDMMLYDNGSGVRLNPCMEINMRMNMGVVSRLFYDRYVCEGANGCYFVKYCKNSGEAYRFHCDMQAAYKPLVRNGKLLRGYMNLSPVTPVSHYIAYALIGDFS